MVILWHLFEILQMKAKVKKSVGRHFCTLEMKESAQRFQREINCMAIQACQNHEQKYIERNPNNNTCFTI